MASSGRATAVLRLARRGRAGFVRLLDARRGYLALGAALELQVGLDHIEWMRHERRDKEGARRGEHPARSKRTGGVGSHGSRAAVCAAVCAARRWRARRAPLSERDHRDRAHRHHGARGVERGHIRCDEQSSEKVEDVSGKTNI